jgi:hypothetical protein
MVIKSGEAMVEESMVILWRAQRILFLFHLDDSVH